MVIEASFTSDPAVAWAATAAFLRTDPIRHNVICTLLQARVASSTPIRFWWATRDGEVRGALFQSPDTFPVSSSVLDPAVVDALAASVAATTGTPITAIDGVADSASRFAGAFATTTGRPARPVEGQRIYEVERITPPAGVPGAARLAAAGDEELLATWLAGFAADTGTAHSSEADHRVAAEIYVKTGRLHLWGVDGTPRASTYEQVPAEDVVRVGFVYTPPGERGHGYASALVAEVSSRILAAGQRCILYTQLANPVSNRIYQRLGYRPVAEVVRYRFD